MSVAHRRRPRTVVGLAVFALPALGACLDPLVSDAIPPRGLVWPPGKEIPAFAATEAGRTQIGANDGVPDGLIPLRTGFSNGKAIAFWDFGVASPNAIPLYLLVKQEEGGAFATARGDFNPVGHAPIFDAIPGDPVYSPWWTVVLLPVTDKWTDSVLGSFEAVDEATALGLLDEPIPLPFAINCPVVLPDARLELVGGGDPRPPSRAYYRGTWVHYFDFGTYPIADEVITVGDVYQLRREGGEPLSEPVRGVDLNGDGDAGDTNDIFALQIGDAAYTGLIRLTEVVVAPDTPSLDSPEGPALKALTDLFAADGGDLVPKSGVVRAVYPDETVLNWPLAAKSPEAE